MFSTAMGSRRTLTVISSLGGLLFGYDTDIISGNVLYVRDDLGILLSRIGIAILDRFCAASLFSSTVV